MTCGECANVTAPGSGFPNHVYCRRFLLHMEKREDASRCRDFIPKPQTNADRIRAMSDEELARYYAKRIARCYGCEAVTGDDCFECQMDWLKAPVEEGDK